MATRLRIGAYPEGQREAQCKAGVCTRELHREPERAEKQLNRGARSRCVLYKYTQADALQESGGSDWRNDS